MTLKSSLIFIFIDYFFIFTDILLRSFDLLLYKPNFYKTYIINLDNLDHSGFLQNFIQFEKQMEIGKYSNFAALYARKPWYYTENGLIADPKLLGCASLMNENCSNELVRNQTIC